jgi:hypothetical protein
MMMTSFASGAEMGRRTAAGARPGDADARALATAVPSRSEIHIFKFVNELNEPGDARGRRLEAEL